jgi:hypothetical protein
VEAQLELVFILDLIHQEAIHMMLLVLPVSVLQNLEPMMYQGLPLASTL